MAIVALTFGAPGLLGWMALAAVPLVIHLLHRQRHQVMDWAAMKWLLAAIKKNQRWIRVEQWLLLALRTLLIALAAFAMTKPAFDEAGSLFTVVGPSRHHIFVLDPSMSMQYSEGTISRFDRAKEMAVAILDDARQGDFASVVLMGSPPVTLVGEASPYLTSVAQEIEAVGPTDGIARMEQAIDPIAQILRASPASRH